MPGGGAQRFGMFKVPSLVFDIELEDNGIGGGWCQEEEWEEDEIVSEIQRFVQPTTAAEARLAADVRVALSHCNTATAAAAAEAGPRLVSILTALGYSAALRTALGGGDGADCLRNLRHSFIAVELPTATTPTAGGASAAHAQGGIAGAAAAAGGGGGGIAAAAAGSGMVTGGVMGGYSHYSSHPAAAGACGPGPGYSAGGYSHGYSHQAARRYVVDPVFKEQFIIAKTTSRYSCILGAVPQVFVGPEEHLGLLVQFLCAEMAAAFRQLGSVLPPWRQAASMLSKWAPRKSVDLDVGSGGGRPGAAAAAAAAGGGASAAASRGVGAGGLMAAAVDAHCLQLGGGGGGASCHQQQQAQQVPWPCRPAAAAARPHHFAHHQHHGNGFHAAAAPLPGGGLPPPMPPPSYEMPGAGSRRQSFEPQRVVFGGNFIPVGPTPVS
ncbi:hypothetical protein HXX76_010509 [Chlamydomonas incerta]|uniref:Uncharacterized protein n=1 Tax=Chlamydomonas incerta TaxID=51695 RepID=A0A835VUH2_CHLIN|nr:hypothetical protein HXX76_010509 [Chlamydomonas incerta]|eukprot:KAG2428365.1 hypothetical protein HXX76_010509 [Chlamydomonas incerta]